MSYSLSSVIFLDEKLAMTRGKMVAKLRHELGPEWSQDRLAKALREHGAGANVTRGWVAHLENDNIKKPLRTAEIRALAAVLKQPPETFSEPLAPPSGVVISESPLTYSRGLEHIPVLGVVSAERFSFSFETYPEERLPIPMEPGRKAFALRISGDCMEPTFRDGDYVIISETAQVLDGRVVLALLDGEFTLKRYFKRPKGIELRPDNEKYETRTYPTNKLIIKGVVVGSYRKEM